MATTLPHGAAGPAVLRPDGAGSRAGGRLTAVPGTVVSAPSPSPSGRRSGPAGR